MRARQLEVFIAVMRAGTVTAAARMLSISQPALSQILLHTEDELGFPLFERVKGRLRPTPDALEIFPDAERLSAGLDGLRRKTTDLRLGRAGLVRVAASPPPAMAILPRAFTRFRAQHPRILLRSHSAPIAAIVDMLRAGDASLGVAMDDRLPPDIEAEVIGNVGFSCLLPTGHALARKTELTLSDLTGEELISYRGNTRPADELANAARAQGVPFSPAIEIDASISAVGFVQAGLGIALVDALLPWQQFAGLVVKSLAAGPAFPIALLTSRARALSRADEMMRDEIREACSTVLGDDNARA
ncbi:DNA-binding transcriptional regulator, LysR family [Mesorhizobium sp. NFR06]|jgi:DNA-binding transcriptional LysR family regulator|uniref:LysR family transcriptional regulator n=1 Tax=Mesorhizobium sp. NFR06 TaxID=1566290 RepID=UPI0008F02F14|nr:LysR family transcriptional regulator [Mesorhizobium sp. NFR06]SFP78205.1 DNA-binding transcriptional regulator, LysR family [Mesorhizobium sp. NFR06]